MKIDRQNLVEEIRANYQQFEASVPEKVNRNTKLSPVCMDALRGLISNARRLEGSEIRRTRG